MAYSSLRAKSLLLTGIVTTDDVVVSPQVAGLVTEGDVVKKGQVITTFSIAGIRAIGRETRVESIEAPVGTGN